MFNKKDKKILKTITIDFITSIMIIMSASQTYNRSLSFLEVSFIAFLGVILLILMVKRNYNKFNDEFILYLFFIVYIGKLLGTCIYDSHNIINIVTVLILTVGFLFSLLLSTLYKSKK